MPAGVFETSDRVSRKEFYMKRITTTSVRENDGRAIINYSEHPVCIVRCGYLTNPSEATNLQDEEYQQRLAEAIGNGLVQFYLDHGSNQNRTD